MMNQKPFLLLTLAFVASIALIRHAGALEPTLQPSYPVSWRSEPKQPPLWAAARQAPVIPESPGGSGVAEPGDGAVRDIPAENENEVFELLAPEVGVVPEPTDHPPAPAVPGLISVSFDEVPVPDVVNMFSRVSGANIIVAGVFTNYFVTANLRNVEWQTALNLVLGSVGLSTIEDPSGILMVVTSEMYEQKLKQLEDTKPLVTKVFNPQYLNPVDLVQQIREMNILSPRGRIVTSQSDAQHLASLKSSELTPRPFASSERKQNPSITTVVVITDIKEYVDRAESLLMQLDRREPQVFIEARIIDIVSVGGSKIGFDWGMLESFGIRAGMEGPSWSWSDIHETTRTRDNRDVLYDRRSHTDDIRKRYDIDGRQYEESTTRRLPAEHGFPAREETVITPTRSIDDRISRGRDVTSEYGDLERRTLRSGRAGAALMDVDQVALFLSALKQSGNAKMLAHPLIIVGNRVEATIHVGETTWQIMLKKDQRTEGGIAVDSYSEEAHPIDLGLKLWVIPEIDVDSDIVRLTVNPEMTVPVEDIITAQGSIYPVTSTRTLNTRVNVPSGKTLVIGGLIEYATSKDEKRVPFLGDIPILGLLFRHTTERVEKHNLVIMLTPTILDDASPATGYETMGWQAIEDFDMTPLAPSMSPAVHDAPDIEEEEEDAHILEPGAEPADDVEDRAE